METSWRRRSQSVQGHSVSFSDELAMTRLTRHHGHQHHHASTHNSTLVSDSSFKHDTQQKRSRRAGEQARRRGRLKCNPSGRAGRQHHSPPQHPSNLALGLTSILKEAKAALGVAGSAAGMAMETEMEVKTLVQQCPRTTSTPSLSI